VLLISEELHEILDLADRIVVMHDGQVALEMPAEGARPPRRSAATCWDIIDCGHH
jgi:ABC-type uncharacterized transport system ATPase subunit